MEQVVSMGPQTPQTPQTPQKKFVVYWLISKTNSSTRNYIGATTNITRRIRQHNREIKGGARRTRNRTWELVLYVQGFRTWRETLQFEWAFRHYSRSCRSVHTRRTALDQVMARERWTSRSPLSADVALEVKMAQNESPEREPKHSTE